MSFINAFFISGVPKSGLDHAMPLLLTSKKNRVLLVMLNLFINAISEKKNSKLSLMHYKH